MDDDGRIAFNEFSTVIRDCRFARDSARQSCPKVMHGVPIFATRFGQMPREARFIYL